MYHNMKKQSYIYTSCYVQCLNPKFINLNKKWNKNLSLYKTKLTLYCYIRIGCELKQTIVIHLIINLLKIILQGANKTQKNKRKKKKKKVAKQKRREEQTKKKGNEIQQEEPKKTGDKEKDKEVEIE